jgi:hypothetical protein
MHPQPRPVIGAVLVVIVWARDPVERLIEPQIVAQGSQTATHRVGVVVLFSLNLWGCFAGLVVGVIFLNPFKWLNDKRLVFGCMASSFRAAIPSWSTSEVPSLR